MQALVLEFSLRLAVKFALVAILLVRAARHLHTDVLSMLEAGWVEDAAQKLRPPEGISEGADVMGGLTAPTGHRQVPPSVLLPSVCQHVVLCTENHILTFVCVPAQRGPGSSDKLIGCYQFSKMAPHCLIPSYVPGASLLGAYEPHIRVFELLPAWSPAVVHGFHIKPASSVEVPQVDPQVVRLVHTAQVLVGRVHGHSGVEDKAEVARCHQDDWNAQVRVRLPNRCRCSKKHRTNMCRIGCGEGAAGVNLKFPGGQERPTQGAVGIDQ